MTQDVRKFQRDGIGHTNFMRSFQSIRIPSQSYHCFQLHRTAYCSNVCSYATPVKIVKDRSDLLMKMAIRKTSWGWAELKKFVAPPSGDRGWTEWVVMVIFWQVIQTYLGSVGIFRSQVFSDGLLGVWCLQRFAKFLSLHFVKHVVSIRMGEEGS